MNAGEWNSVFAVPSSVVDKYIKLAGEKPLKLLLYLLRHGGETFSEDKLKSELGFADAGELEDAAKFWIQRGIIDCRDDNESVLTARREEQTAAPKAPEQLTLDGSAPSPAKPASAPAKAKARSPFAVSSGEIARRIKEDGDIRSLFNEVESIYGRPLRQSENVMVISLVDYYGLPAAVALLLINCCNRLGKTNSGYIYAAAQDWSDNGINSVELADAKIRSIEKINSTEQKIRKEFDIQNSFTQKQRELIKVWTEQWNFSEEMIILACGKTIDQLGKWNVNYTNRILENWKNDNISTVEAANSEKQSSKKDESSSFDVDDVMNRIIQKRYGG